MKRSELNRGTPLERHSRIDRKPMKRSQPKRDWTEARAKVERELGCRAGGVPQAGCEGKLEAAHIIGREHDKKPPAWVDSNTWGAAPPSILWVAPARIVPLCQKHHRAYDAHELDLLPYLTVEEQAQAVLDAGGLELARNRVVMSGGAPQLDEAALIEAVKTLGPQGSGTRENNARVCIAAYLAASSGAGELDLTDDEVERVARALHRRDERIAEQHHTELATGYAYRGLAFEEWREEYEEEARVALRARLDRDDEA